MPELELDNFLCFSLYAASHAFTRFYKPLLEPLGLTYPQYLVMVVLGQDNGQTVGQIGERLQLESSTLTPLLKRMEASGLLRRRRDDADERQVRATLTETGQALLLRAKTLPACVGAVLDQDAASLGRLKHDIDRVRDALAISLAQPRTTK